MSEDKRRIRSDVPPGMHPDVLKPLKAALDVQGTPGREALVAADTALGTLYAGYATLNETIAAVKAARANPQPAPLNQRYAQPDLKRSAQIAFDNSGPKIDAAVKNLNGAREKIRKRIDDATADHEARSSVGIAVAGQIREYVRTLKGNRLGFLFDRIRRGDRQTYSAVVNAPPYLSGMNEDEEKIVRELAANSWAREDVEQDKAVARAQELVTKAAQLFVTKYSDVIDGKESADSVAQRALKTLEGVGRG